jgi:hypothetical protein
MAVKRRSGAGRVHRRKIYFFRLDAGMDGAGRPIDIAPGLISELDRCDWRQEADRVETPEQSLLVMKEIRAPRLRMVAVRQGSLPLLFDSQTIGGLSPLPIKEGQSVADQTHFVFFPKRVVGVEYNHYGPRHSALEAYCSKRLRDLVAPFSLNPLLYEDSAEQLRSIRQLRRIEFTLLQSDQNHASRQDRVEGMARALADSVNGERISIEVTARRDRGDSLSVQGALRSLRSMVGRDVAHTAKVHGIDDDGRLVLVDHAHEIDTSEDS